MPPSVTHESLALDLLVRDPAGGRIVAPGARLSKLASGFEFLEGPVWLPEGALRFSDIPRSIIYTWRPDGKIETFRNPSNKANGNTLDRQGRLLTCEHLTRRVTRTEADGTIAVLSDSHEGKTLNSPNDIVVKTDGAIYFTDPTGGRSARMGREEPQELPFQGVYRLDPETREQTLLCSHMHFPNGLCFNPDETVLYVNDSRRSHIEAFPVTADGALGAGAVFAKLESEGPGVADGLKIDSRGNVYCSSPGGINVFDPSGRWLLWIKTPEVAANFTWGGEDRKTLFLAASTSLYSLPVTIPGRPLL